MSKVRGFRPPGGQFTREELRATQAAARAKVTVDRRRGIKTEEWIVQLAEGKDPYNRLAESER